MLEIRNLSVDSLVPDEQQPRAEVSAEMMERLAASIRLRGVLAPLRVRYDGEFYRIVVGESRWRGAKLAGLETVPCIVLEGEITPAEILMDQLIENAVRDELPGLDLGRAIHRLKQMRKTTSQALAAEMGISGSAITRAESLVTLPESIQQMIGKTLSESAAYSISRLASDDEKLELARLASAGGWSRQRVEEAVQSRIGKKKANAKTFRLACRLDTGVSVSVSSGGSLDWDELIGSLDRIRKTAKRLCDDGKEVTALAQAFRAG